MSDIAQKRLQGPLSAEDVRTLMDVGYIALSARLDEHAAAIFEGVKAARPAHEAGFIGRALVDIARGDIDAATKALRSLPPSDTARTFLAMALIHQGDHHEARKILADVITSAGDCPASVLARAMLDGLDAPELQLKGLITRGAQKTPLH